MSPQTVLLQGGICGQFRSRFRPHTLLFECFEDLSDGQHPIPKYFNDLNYQVCVVRWWLLGVRETSLHAGRPVGKNIDTYIAKTRYETNLGALGCTWCSAARHFVDHAAHSLWVTGLICRMEDLP